MNTVMKNRLENILLHQGVIVNGNRPQDIQIHNPLFYQRVLREGSLGLGESYMDGWWDCDRIDELYTEMINRKVHQQFAKAWPVVLFHLLGLLSNRQRLKPYHIGQWHYDLGNAFYLAMLGPSMAYSCGYWKDADNLDQAQINKWELICRKLNLQKWQRVLDIGCGWGGFARYAAEKYEVLVEGVTVSRKQARYANELCRGLPVEIHFQDYRKVKGTFDYIVSVGMFEHVGYKNYKEFMQTVRRLLKVNGLFLLHTIGSRQTTFSSDPWLLKYIFPDSKTPSLKQICEAAEKEFVIEDVHNFGADYDKTLMAWYRNFEFFWTTQDHALDDRFYRMWRYYLLSCAALFRTRQQQLWQIVLSPQGARNGYQSIR